MTTVNIRLCLMFSTQWKRNPLIELEEGNAQVVARPKAEYMAEGLHAFFIVSVGFDLLARNYPDYITFNGLKEA